jgi:predicted nucleotidyltransferase
MMKIPPDFREFLKLLNDNSVEYLLIGGYAVNYYGYPRPTGDMDIWIRIDRKNAERTIVALDAFGFSSPKMTVDLLTKDKQIIRMGVPPFRLEISTGIDGVEFEECFNNREVVDLDGVPTNLISLRDLKINKKASGRYKDLNDLENLS